MRHVVVMHEDETLQTRVKPVSVELPDGHVTDLKKLLCALKQASNAIKVGVVDITEERHN